MVELLVQYKRPLEGEWRNGAYDGRGKHHHHHFTPEKERDETKRISFCFYDGDWLGERAMEKEHIFLIMGQDNVLSLVIVAKELVLMATNPLDRARVGFSE